MKQVIYYVSLTQFEEKKKGETQICTSKEIWVKAQAIAENHLYGVGNIYYRFPNREFFLHKYEKITKDLLDLHIYAIKYAKNLIDYRKRRCLRIYNHQTKVILFISLINL